MLCTLFGVKAANVDPTDPKWEEFIAVEIEDIPNKNLKNYLLDNHHNNPYALKLTKQHKALGPFSPDLDNVFWINVIWSAFFGILLAIGTN